MKNLTRFLTENLELESIELEEEARLRPRRRFEIDEGESREADKEEKLLARREARRSSHRYN
jgi:hypothetical protein